ncbi:MAG: lysophospholipid acyltransferase family protein [Muribaculaceae bacterium]
MNNTSDKMLMSENNNKESNCMNSETERLPMSFFRQPGYYALALLINVLSRIPFCVLYVLSDIIYFPLYYVGRYRRKVVRKNLVESFPDKSLRELVAIEKKFYHSFIDIALESCKMMTISYDDIRRHIRFENVELANAMLREGKNVGLFMGHFGNWEWVASLALWLWDGALASQIYHRLRNHSMDRLMKQMRERFGSVCVEMRDTVRFVREGLNDERPYIIGFIADQSPKFRESKYFVPFLNHDTPVLTGSEKVVKRYGYQAVFLGVRRVRRGYYECTISSLHPNAPELPDFELTRLYFQKLEEEITQRPELYLWTHNRFKHARN